MAYMNQDMKKAIVQKAKPILKKYGIKGTFAVDNHSTIVANIWSGDLDIVGNYNENLDQYKVTNGYIQINTYHINGNFSGQVQSFLEELFSVMNDGNYNNSRIEIDYFDVGWYVRVNVGSYKKPYVHTA